MCHIFSLFSFSSKELKTGELTTTRRDDAQPPARKQKWPISSHSPVRRCRRIKRSYISKKSQNGPGGKEQAEQFSDELNCYLNFGLFPTTIPAIRDPAHL